MPFIVVACLLGAAAYLPILNNGFIADDYVILQRVEFLKVDPLYLYHVAPENFRMVSYLIFGALKAVVGYHAWPFYAVNISLHLANIILLSRLLQTLLSDKATARLAVLFFAVFQAPQEAVMWLAAMNETTLFFFAVLTLLCWSRERRAPAAAFYAVALFCKESAVLIPVLVLLMDLYQGKHVSWRKYGWMAVPTAVFAAVFLATLSTNFMLTNRSYAVGVQALLVLGKSLHRLVWPWLYIVLLLVGLKTRRWPSVSSIAAYLACIVVMMLPYMLIAYQTSLPSRQLYLASAAFMTMLAVHLRPLFGTFLMKVIVVAFVAFNIGYLWVRKDPQFEERAAPTTQLVDVLRQHRPQRTLIKNFAYPYPDIAKAAALAVPGWDPAAISTGEGDGECRECLWLTWNHGSQTYDVATQH
jgi:hypothetical protein